MKLQWPWVSRKKYEAETLRLARVFNIAQDDYAALALLRMNETTKLRSSLRAVADCETPSANATVRRMARIAREALGK